MRAGSGRLGPARVVGVAVEGDAARACAARGGLGRPSAPCDEVGGAAERAAARRAKSLPQPRAECQRRDERDAQPMTQVRLVGRAPIGLHGEVERRIRHPGSVVDHVHRDRAVALLADHAEAVVDAAAERSAAVADDDLARARVLVGVRVPDDDERVRVARR